MVAVEQIQLFSTCLPRCTIPFYILFLLAQVLKTEKLLNLCSWKDWVLSVFWVKMWCLPTAFKCDAKGFFTTSTYEFIVRPIALLPWTGCFRHQHKRTYSVLFGNNSSFDTISVFHTLQNEMGLEDVYYWPLKKLMMLTVIRGNLPISCLYTMLQWASISFFPWLSHMHFHYMLQLSINQFIKTSPSIFGTVGH